jgi:hypothetical protein
VVDIFSNMVHFILFHKTRDATHIENLFFKEIVRLHGVPRSIFSNIDTKFMGHFWRTLSKNLGTNLSFTSAYHPQKDGQTEVVNQSLGNFLRSLVTEHNSQWDQILPQADFAYNNSPNRSIGKSPFKIIYGMHQRGISELRYLGQTKFQSAGVEDFVAEMQKLYDKSKASYRITARDTREEYIREEDR